MMYLWQNTFLPSTTLYYCFQSCHLFKWTMLRETFLFRWSFAIFSKYNQRMNEKQENEMRRATCQFPDSLEKLIAEMVKINDYNKSQSGFCIKVREHMTSLHTRMLLPLCFNTTEIVEKAWLLREKANGT